MTVTLKHPWLVWDFGADQRVFSWALNIPGFANARRVVWRELRNADLPPDLDVTNWLEQELAQNTLQDAPCLLTSRRVDTYEFGQFSADTTTAECLATVGLSNAERVGARVDRSNRDWNRDLGAKFGTINIATRLNRPLTDAAMIEALSIVVQARTAAILEIGHRLPTGLATGTGTDCALVAAPMGPNMQKYAGLHTDIGAALGGAVYAAVHRAALHWQATIGTISEG